LVIKNPGTCHYDAMASSPARFACICGLASIAVVTSARTAHALGPVDVEVGAKVGVGAEYSGGPNPLGFGLGGRAGVVLFDHLYGGVNLMYYFGAGGGTYTLMYGVEAGWGFKPFDTVTIRPQVGLGNASFGYTSVDQCPLQSGCYGATFYPTTDSGYLGRNDLYVEPGVTVLVVPVGTVFVGADVNFLVLPALAEDSRAARVFITLHGQVGVKF